MDGGEPGPRQCAGGREGASPHCLCCNTPCLYPPFQTRLTCALMTPTVATSPSPISCLTSALGTKISNGWTCCPRPGGGSGPTFLAQNRAPRKENDCYPHSPSPGRDRGPCPWEGWVAGSPGGRQVGGGAQSRPGGRQGGPGRGQLGREAGAGVHGGGPLAQVAWGWGQGARGAAPWEQLMQLAHSPAAHEAGQAGQRVLTGVSCPPTLGPAHAFLLPGRSPCCPE